MSTRTSSFIIASALTLALAPLWAYDPPAGAETALSLSSPSMLAGGTSAASTDSPMADLANPAASGLLQRTTLDASYAALLGLGAETGWGNVVNLGLAAPKPYGVWTAYLGVVSSPFASMPLGTVFTGRVGMAKDLFPDLLVGLALDGSIGGSGGFGWGAGADIGVIGLVGDLSFMKDFAWGASLRNMGKAYTAPGAVGLSGASPASGYESPFTPQVGVSATLARASDLALSGNADLWLPSFQNAVFSAGLKLGWKDKAFLRLGWDFNLAEALAGADQSLLPSIGIGASFAIDREKDDSFISKAGLDRSEIRPSFAASALNGGVWAFGGGVNIPLGVLDRTPPTITVDYPKTSFDAYYISPNNDGTLDEAVLPLTIVDQRYVAGFTLKVYDESGAVVRAVANKESRPENQDWTDLFRRLLYVKEGVDVPESLVWNGMADSGDRVPDGRYYVVVDAVDDNGNAAATERWAVVVDTAAPSVSAAGPGAAGEPLIFSPDGDGGKDTLAIRQTGSPEDLWTGEILDAAGTVVRVWKTTASAPADAVWDGKNDAGQIMPDGVYAYRVGSVDRAGNAVSAKVENIIVNTQQPPVGVAIDLAAFSPNGDGVKDSLTLSPGVPVRTGLSSWSLSVLDESGKERWSATGTDTLLERYAFVGKGSDGAALPEGVYRTRLTATYVNGHAPVVYSPSFVIDLTAPQAQVAVDRAAFNPLSEARSVVVISQKGSAEERWTGEMRDASGKAVKTWTFIGTPDLTVEWDGSDDAGRVVNDGAYTYRLSATDKAGNVGVAAGPAIAIDTEKKAVRLSLDRRAFSPNGDGVGESVALAPESQSSAKIRSWAISILNADGAKVRAYSGAGALPAKQAWDGKTDSGARAPDGIYQALLEVRFVTDEVEVARSVDMALDTAPPSITLSVEDALFSPNGDGRKDAARVTQSSVPGDTWTGRVLDAAGKAVRSWTWKDAAASFAWDGTDAEGNRLPDGAYRYVVSSEDPAGNKAERSIDRLVIDTKQTQVFVTASAAGFSPNGDGAFDAISFGLMVNVKDGVDGWTLSMVDQAGATRRVFSGVGGATIPAKQAWDGKGDDGAPVQGDFTAVFAVSYQKGDRAEARSAPFAVDIEGPKVSMDVKPRYFSPDNDGVDDELRIALAVADASDIESWKFEIIEVAVSEDAKAARKERPFFTWTGKGRPAERLSWDGRSQKGELVEAATDYPFRLTITDSLGNKTVQEGTISVDVLVIREGDKLKIKVPSIVFRPNFADFKELTPEVLARNADVLKRIAIILNRFKDYKIRVEGHANSVAKASGQGQAAIDKEEKTELLPLSEARARLVMEKLIEYGVDPRRLSVLGLGSSEPVVPFTDGDNRWKNRRVEFILIKE